MALPASIENERNRFLLSKVDSASFKEILKWPKGSKDDFAQIGQIILEFGQIDTQLRSIVELIYRFDKGQIPVKWHSKIAKMTIGDTEDALRTSSWISDKNAEAVEIMRECRRMRNMMAHFMMRRFPDEDALVFITKSDEDARRAFGSLPAPGQILTGVVDASELPRKLKQVAALAAWITDIAIDVGDHYFSRRCG
jgi:hypothetical protein